MQPIFMIKRKDGKTDNVYECDFKLGIFTGGAQQYTYDDIEDFLYIPSEIVAGLIYRPEKKKADKPTEKTDE